MLKLQQWKFVKSSKLKTLNVFAEESSPGACTFFCESAVVGQWVVNVYGNKQNN